MRVCVHAFVRASVRAHRFLCCPATPFVSERIQFKLLKILCLIFCSFPFPQSHLIPVTHLVYRSLYFSSWDLRTLSSFRAGSCCSKCEVTLRGIICCGGTSNDAKGLGASDVLVQCPTTVTSERLLPLISHVMLTWTQYRVRGYPPKAFMDWYNSSRGASSGLTMQFL